jgi:hypothetical protein
VNATPSGRESRRIGQRQSTLSLPITDDAETPHSLVARREFGTQAATLISNGHGQREIERASYRGEPDDAVTVTIRHRRPRHGSIPWRRDDLVVVDKAVDGRASCARN